MSDEEAMELGRRAIYAAQHRDAYSGNVSRFDEIQQRPFPPLGMTPMDLTPYHDRFYLLADTQSLHGQTRRLDLPRQPGPDRPALRRPATRPPCLQGLQGRRRIRLRSQDTGTQQQGHAEGRRGEAARRDGTTWCRCRGAGNSDTGACNNYLICSWLGNNSLISQAVPQTQSWVLLTKCDL